MEIIGRLTADAKVNELTDGRKVVNFNIAMNESYRIKDSDEIKKITTYFNCSYWTNGRIGIDTYTDNSGEVKATLTFHVNSIKLHGKPSKDSIKGLSQVVENENESDKDDLPF